MRLHFLQDVIGNGAENRCFNEAGRHGIHANTLRAELATPGFGETDDAKLAGGIVGLAKVAIDADHRTGIENHAVALRHHGVSDGLGAMKHAAQIHVDDPVELRQRHLLQPGVLRNAGVVDQYVDAAKPRLDVADHRIDHGALGHVHDVTNGLRAQRCALPDRVINRGLPDVADDDDGAFLCKFEGCGQADALGRAGDEADLVVESLHWDEWLLLKISEIDKPAGVPGMTGLARALGRRGIAVFA